MKPRKRRAVVAPEREHASLRELRQLRLLAHPLRLRILQAFGERPSTTKQVAERLGQPPTRLYHHVYALERAGLLRLKETRPNRGTVERYYEPAAPRFELGRGLQALAESRVPAGRERSAAARPALAAGAVESLRAATSVLDLALDELHSFTREAAPVEAGLEPVVARMSVMGSPSQLRSLRAELMKVLERHQRAQGRSGPRTPALHYVLTIAFVPARDTAPKPPRRATRRKN